MPKHTSINPIGLWECKGLRKSLTEKHTYSLFSDLQELNDRWISHLVLVLCPCPLKRSLWLHCHLCQFVWDVVKLFLQLSLIVVPMVVEVGGQGARPVAEGSRALSVVVGCCFREPCMVAILSPDRGDLGVGRVNRAVG